MTHHPSIRDRLEEDAWRNHPDFARRQSGRRGPNRPGRPLGWQDRALLIVASVLLLLLIVRVETARADATGAEVFGLEFSGAGNSQHQLALDTDIRVDVSGLNARIEVTQVFRNGADHWAEAVYRYPLPLGAAVDRMQIQVGTRVLEGEIQEKETARRRYQQAKASGRTASLVEQQRINQFQTRLANIAPGETIRVQIGFLTRVDYRDGMFSLRIPMTFTPRWGGSPDEAPLTFARPDGADTNQQPVPGKDDHRLTIDVDLRSGMDLARIESRYHDVDIHPGLGGYRVFLADPDTRTDRVFELNWAPEFGTAPESTLSTFDDGASVFAQLMLAPPLAAAIASRPREVVFIIDTSGSMEGTSIRQARAALKLGLGFLGADDRFNLVRFSSDTEALFDESVPAYPAYLSEASDFIDDLSANGGTVMAPALDLAMNLPAQDGLLRQIIFVTDGSVGNENELLLRIAEELRDSRLFTVSIGSAPNAWFMRKAAEIGRGSHTRVGRLSEVEERITELWAHIQSPAVENLCVDWGMPADFYPEIIPDLYAGEPLWLYARLPAQPGEVTVCGELEGRYWETVSRQLPGQAGPGLATLWARSKVEALQDSRLFGTDAAQIREDILAVALEFGLLTQYTSLVAVDRTPARPAGADLESSEIPGLLPAGNTPSAGFSQTASGWLIRLILSTLCLMAATGMLLYLPPPRARGADGDHSPMTASST